MRPRRYLTWTPPPGSGDPRLGLVVTTAGMFSACDHAVVDRTRDDHLLLHCRDGHGRVRIGDFIHDLQAGELYWAPPGLAHDYVSDPRDGWDIAWVHFHGDQAGDLAAYAGLTPAVPVRPFPAEGEVASGLTDICAILRSRSLTAGAEAALRLHRFLAGLGIQDRARSLRDHGIAPALAGNHTDVTTMAAACGLSPFHFSRRFREATGTSPWRYVLSVRISRAKELLADRRRPVKQIARELGFADPDYFSRAFRRETGMSARDYRRRLG